MNRETLIWTCVFLVGAGALAVRAFRGPYGQKYVQAQLSAYVQRQEPGDKKPTWKQLTAQGDAWELNSGGRTEAISDAQVEARITSYKSVPPNQRREKLVSFSWAKTAAVWIAALMTLCALSFLWGDNPWFKVMQSIAVGASAGYEVVTGFWTKIVPELIGNLLPNMVRAWALPGLPDDAVWKPIYLVPLVLSLMLLWRLAPIGGWISRWPLAFFIGLLAGVNLVNIFKSDFIEQVRNTALPLIVMTDLRFNLFASLRNAGIVAGVLSSLTYFFFSVEHKGAVGGVAKVGIWVLMITFGASFGLTVMTRITVFSERLQFLFDDWLWLIDPLGNRAGM